MECRLLRRLKDKGCKDDDEVGTIWWNWEFERTVARPNDVWIMGGGRTSGETAALQVG